ncbi:hypothetical protein LOAG_06400 [Loa loa]|uniref:Uncharacterized protein n=1 Tax=Loa loa TaxID=7209 RepID=A0A1S0TXW9_LOALO|nr:hypothetical protein LOAG_06400 [Loa loa]EFO22085.1 hypothetical protein LOAG_06400 [Loa loa]
MKFSRLEIIIALLITSATSVLTTSVGANPLLDVLDYDDDFIRNVRTGNVKWMRLGKRLPDHKWMHSGRKRAQNVKWMKFGKQNDNFYDYQ